ncbi:MAG TPA: SPFH domain-containing protein [Polyangiaceae bacterium]|nr:SPFH domain-containing protein [Polyangiaceae bacterium]
MGPETVMGLFAFCAFALVFLISSLKRIRQWEVALRFTFGRFTGRLGPGLRMVLPVVHDIRRVDGRVRNRDVPRQMVITHDNVTTTIDAVVYYRVVNPERAVIDVENYETAVLNCAQVVLRDVCGETMLDHLLAHRDEIAAKVRVQVEEIVAPWGIRVELIALQDIRLPTQMQEVIAKKAIAERDRIYVVIKSQADVESAKNFAEAARILATQHGAMELRRLEALQTLSQGTSKVIFDLAKSEGEVVKGAAAIAEAVADRSEPPVVAEAGAAQPILGAPALSPQRALPAAEEAPRPFGAPRSAPDRDT